MPTDTRHPGPEGDRSLMARLGILLAGVFAVTLLSPLLPRIELDNAFADLIVRATDTGTWPQMVLVSVGAIVMVITRPGISPQRRGVEAGALALAMVVLLAGAALINEHLLKPAFAIPRPNIVALADAGSLGGDFPDAESLYGVGGKGDRRAVLGEQLPAAEQVAVSDLVRAHWIHETGYSFPSGHARAAMTLATMMAAVGYSWLTGWRRVIAVYVLPIWAIAIVYSRVLLEVHRSVDVIVGTLLGFLWGLLAFAAVRWIVTRYSAREPAKPNG